MKRIISAVGMLLMAISVWAAPFEGEVDYEVVNPNMPAQKLMLSILKSGFRVDFNAKNKPSNPDAPTSMIYQDKERLFYMVNSKNKTFLKKQFKKNSKKNILKVVIKDTGKKDVVAGMNCSIYSYKDDHSKGEMCAIQGMDIPFDTSLNELFNHDSSASPISTKGLFPLRQSLTDSIDNLTIKTTVTRLERKFLKDSLLDIPKDYKEIASPLNSFGNPDSNTKEIFDPSSQEEFQKKMMKASPEEQEKLIAEQQKKMEEFLKKMEKRGNTKSK